MHTRCSSICCYAVCYPVFQRNPRDYSSNGGKTVDLPCYFLQKVTLSAPSVTFLRLYTRRNAKRPKKLQKPAFLDFAYWTVQEPNNQNFVHSVALYCILRRPLLQ